MFLHRSFVNRSFNPTSWRFPDGAVVPPVEPAATRSYAIGAIREREPALRRRLPAASQAAEEEFLVAVITALYATGIFED